uniref:TraB domain-containing protein n=1 Tax=Leersia perrieri TaxID=77586 RepID=A0A0D9XAG7_9ORYZ
MSMNAEDKYPDLFLGKSKHGVYCARIKSGYLSVWFLSEWHGEMKWVLKHRSQPSFLLPRLAYDDQQSDGESWILQHADYKEDYEFDYNASMYHFQPLQHRYDYEETEEEKRHAKYVTFLGFHPFEEVVFLAETFRRGFAYDLNNSKIQDLADTTQDEKAAGSPYELYEKLSISYPSLLQPLIHARDMFLAWSLKRSKAVNKSKTVVGIIGKGHMNGVVYALISDQGDLRFRDLVGRASSDTWASSLIKGLVRDTMAIGVVLWALYEQLQAVF